MDPLRWTHIGQFGLAVGGARVRTVALIPRRCAALGGWLIPRLVKVQACPL